MRNKKREWQKYLDKCKKEKRQKSEICKKTKPETITKYKYKLNKIFSKFFNK